MENQIIIESPDGTFHAYISQLAKLPAAVVVVLRELFGVNAGIRATCDELISGHRAGKLQCPLLTQSRHIQV